MLANAVTTTQVSLLLNGEIVSPEHTITSQEQSPRLAQRHSPSKSPLRHPQKQHQPQKFVPVREARKISV